MLSSLVLVWATAVSALRMPAVRMQASAFSTLPSNRQGLVERLHTLTEGHACRLLLVQHAGGRLRALCERQISLAVARLERRAILSMACGG